MEFSNLFNITRFIFLLNMIKLICKQRSLDITYIIKSLCIIKGAKGVLINDVDNYFLSTYNIRYIK